MELWKDGPQFEQSEHFRLGTDSVLLADFVNIGARRRGIDLGCGSGILPLLLLTRSTALHMTGLELNPEAARVARENIAANALDRRREARCCVHWRMSAARPRSCAERAARFALCIAPSDL